jgi:hypothetical protein
MAFGLMHLKIKSLAASTMVKHSCNIGTNKIIELVFNSDSEEHCTSDV